MSAAPVTITPDLLLRAYRLGMFPMAASRDDATLHWLDPERRGILPLHGLHLPRRLVKTLRSGRFEVTADTVFAQVIEQCAQTRRQEAGTWINHEIQHLFITLHQLGFAHSIESWQAGRLVGGLYGLALGGVFFGESMFSTATDASKVALAHLVARLRLGGYQVLDTQFITSHLARFGAIEIEREVYQAMLATALEVPARFLTNPAPDALAEEFDAIRRECP